MTIPQGTQFHGVAPGVDTENKGSAQANALRDAYTIDEILAYVSSGLGWARYDDGQYTSSNKLSLTDGVEVVLPNNAANIVRSHSGFDYYNGTTQKILAENENDTYVATVVFYYSALNANQTFLRLQLDATNGTPYRRVGKDIAFPKGNEVEHQFHEIFQWYSDDAFVANGSQFKITASGGTAEVWDIIYFIQRTQYYGG